MSYSIYKTDGSLLTTINDGTVDSTTDLILVGKNYSGYGQYQNSNFVKLLQNFCNSSAPAAPLEGELWYDNVNKSIKVYNATGFKLPPAAVAASSAPINKNTGDLWYDSTNQQLNCYDGSTWKVIGPAYSSSLGVTGDVIDYISDGSNNHLVIKKYLQGSLISVVSKDSTFTPSPSVSGFPTIHPGYNISSNYDLNVELNGYFGGDITVTGTVNGNATSASTVGVTDTTVDLVSPAGPYYLTFVTSTSGNQSIRTDSNSLTYDPTTNTLSVGTMVGTVSNATNISVTNTPTTNATYYLTFVDGISGNRTIRTDGTTLTYNPSSDTLTVANLSGNASTATSATSATSATTSSNLSGGLGGSIPYQSTVNTTSMLAIGPNGYVLTSTGSAIQWSASPSAANVTITDTTTGTGPYYLAFVGGTSGSQGMLVDSSTLSYNATSNTLTVANIAGNASTATSLSGGDVGYLPYQSATGVTGYLAAGTNGYVLTSTGSGITWSSSPAASNVTITDTPTTAGTYYVTFVGGTSGSQAVRTDSSTLTYDPSTNTLTTTNYSGTASQAKYADLAERYASDASYEPGTLVKIGGMAEVTLTTIEADEDVFGVVSEKPAYLMNSDAGPNESHPPIALKGRVPVLVIGNITKGQRLISSMIPGVAKGLIGSQISKFAVFGRALESSDDLGIKLIEAVVGVN